MRFGALLLAAAMAISPAAAAADPLPSGRPYTMADTAVLTLMSDAGEDYRVYVAWPAGDPPASGWPVLYLLDGEDQFPVAVATARRLARARARSGVQTGMVVAIEAGPLARRVRDYTPDAGPDAIPPGAPAHGLATGGADAFLAFVATRVRPAIAARWPVDGGRETLAGHSFGGLAALYDLARFRHFDGYAAISPSLWYGGGKALPAVAAPGGAPVRALIASGSEEAGPAATAGASGAQWAEQLRGQRVDARFTLLPGQSHGTTMLASIADIIGFAFAGGGGQ